MLLGLVFCVCFIFVRYILKKNASSNVRCTFKTAAGSRCVTYLNVPDKKQIISLQNLAAIEPDI